MMYFNDLLSGSNSVFADYEPKLHTRFISSCTRGVMLCHGVRLYEGSVGTLTAPPKSVTGVATPL